MTPAEMADWLDREAAGHERDKARSGPYEASHPGDEDAAKCRAIAGWIRETAGDMERLRETLDDPQKA